MAKKTNQPEQTSPQKTEEQEKQEPRKDEKQELIEQLQRLQAEFENYRKRAENDLQQAKTRGEDTVIKELLPVVDSFELAIKHNANCSDKELLKGTELIYSQLLSHLERLGVHRIPEGTVDPRLHEVYIVEHTERQEEDNTVIETLQHGYVRNGTVLRTAKIKAARKTP